MKDDWETIGQFGFNIRFNRTLTDKEYDRLSGSRHIYNGKDDISVLPEATEVRAALKEALALTQTEIALAEIPDLYPTEFYVTTPGTENL